MFDNICSLPTSADIFAQAIHPTLPIFTVGLASGVVQTFRLPSVDNSSTTAHLNGAGKRSSIDSTGRRLSESGFDTIDTVWRTRRHKGSCRTLAYSDDGGVLFSAGSEAVVKAADMETGRVVSKVMLPGSTSSQPDAPSVLHALSPQNLLLGTDTGRLHIYDLREPSSTLTHNARPARTLQPHALPDGPAYSEPLTSLTPLPPNSSSTSGTSRTWITTSGSTLAVSDLRKGVVKVSEDQGDVLLSSACVPGLGMSKKRRKMMGGEGVGAEDKVLVGGSSGLVMLFDRGQWEDQSGRVVVHRGGAGDDDGTIDSLAVLPGEGGGKSHTVVAGLGTGEIKFVRLKGGGGTTVGEVRHDETGVEAVATLGFDVFGRLISGGGQVIKVWRRNVVSDYGSQSYEAEGEEDGHANGLDSEESDEEEGTGGLVEADMGSDDDEDEDEDSDQQPKKQKKRKKGKQKVPSRPHGIAAFTGMD